MTPADPFAAGPTQDPTPPGPTIPEPTPGPSIPTEEPPGLFPPPAPNNPTPPAPDTPLTPHPVHPEPSPTPAPPPGPGTAPVGPMATALTAEAAVPPGGPTDVTGEAAETPPGAETPGPPPAVAAAPAQPVPAVPPAPQPHDLSRIAQDLQIRKQQVEAVVQLLDEDNTVPFITRYRKERTGGLDEEFIRRIQDRVKNLRALADRKQTILKSIAFQGRLTDDLVRAILGAETPKRLEDLYLPFKPKKKSKATEAREKGLGPLAEAVFHRDPAVANLDEVLPGLVDPDKWLLNTDEVLAGVKDVLADLVADAADVRGPLRNYIWDQAGLAATKVETLPEGKGREYEPYFAFKEHVREIPPHRVLAINRGEKANVLRVHLDLDRAMANEIAAYHLGLADHPHRELMTGVVADALDRLVLPSLEREVRRELTERSQDHAIGVFARNLRSLLLQPPLRGKRVLAVDPGIRTGCKLAALDETGNLLEDAVVYIHGAKKGAADARRKLEQMVRKYQTPVVAIGNGTGCRDAEQLVADLIADLENRRLNPQPAAPAAETVSSEAAAPPAPVVSDPPAPADAPPVVSEVPPPLPAGDAPAGTLTSDAVLLPPAAGATISFDVPVVAAPATVETTGTPAPAAETVTTGAPGVGPAPAPPPPKAPPVSLEGLPDAPPELAYVVVIEAGASDYSAGPVAREEFPHLDATTRGTISIGRRLQDPLAELVKIDPQHIGVGLYQHDVKPKHLKESLEAVIESCVNQVGVDLNTASVPLLRHVSGLNQLVAREVVDYRQRNGPFASREQLRQVPNLGDKRFTQAAGFLKLPDAADPLDATGIHPESYPTARQILTDYGFTPADLRDRAKLDDLRGRLATIDPAAAADALKVGEPTVRDILDALARPGRDPREDLPPPIFKTGVLKLEDITPGMELKGTVLNVVPFGAFVDVGLKESGLVHISQMANRYIKSPYDVAAVGDVVTVWVIEVKPGDKKISLTMIPPGHERRVGGGRSGAFAAPGPRGEPRGEFRGGPPHQQPQPAGDRPAPAPRPERPPLPPRPEPRPAFAGGRGPVGPGGSPRPFNRGPGGPGGPGGRGPGGPPRPQQGPSDGNLPGQAAEGVAPPPTLQPPAGPPQQARPQPPRPPAKPKPLPKLTAEKKTGKVALNTFGELAAFFSPPPPPEPEVKAEPKAEARQPEVQPDAPAADAPPPA